MYADDTHLTCADNDICSIEASLNQDLSNINCWLIANKLTLNMTKTEFMLIGPLHDPVTWYRINYTGMQITQWDFQNKGKSGWTGVSSFVLEAPLRNLCPSVIYSVPCDRIVQRAYWIKTKIKQSSRSPCLEINGTQLNRVNFTKSLCIN